MYDLVLAAALCCGPCDAGVCVVPHVAVVHRPVVVRVVQPVRRVAYRVRSVQIVRRPVFRGRLFGRFGCCR